MTFFIVGDDVEACRMPVRAMLALYIGGMGAKGKNFYTDYAKRLGYEEAALNIQDLYLAGKKGDAMAAVLELPDPPKTSLKPGDVLSCFRQKLWDPDKGRMVGYPS